MSATNWADCPRCNKEYNQKIENMQRALRDAYGKVSLEEYQRLEADCEQYERLGLDTDTLREVYELGVYQGKFFINYHGGCSRCGFNISFNHRQDALEMGEKG